MLPGPEDFAAAVHALRRGEPVAFPTETVYGLGADALSEPAVARVFELKGRPANNPLIVHVATADAARDLSTSWDSRAQALARAFWPGPLSIVVPRSRLIPPIVTAGSPNVAFRCPDHPAALALLTAFAGPLVGPSANRSGGVSPTTSAHVREAFPHLLVLEGGPSARGIESTVVSLAGTRPRVLRPGVISAAQLAEVLGAPVDASNVAPAASAPGAASAEPLPSPGLLASHYAPAAPVLLLSAADIHADPARLAHAVVIHHTPLALPASTQSIRLPASADRYAARLYAALREADSARPSAILIERPTPASPDTHIWLAILDRLERAAAPRP
ncbi:MAG: threonylcarbamoyl-AMP synthase [Phycisphaerales bacterium]|nr:threonylcarbamoyl-AMP synthase [Phycisphaerales bacterium]